MWRSVSLTTRLTCYLLTATAFIFAITFFNSRNYTTEALLIDADRYAKELLGNQAARLSGILNQIEAQPKLLDVAYESELLSTDMLLHLAETMTMNSDMIFGSALAFEPYAYEPNTKDYAPYIYKKDDFPVKITLPSDPSYHYREKPWYTQPKKLMRPVWTEPYFDNGGGNILMTTYSLPIVRKEQFIAVLTVDVSLSWLANLVKKLDSSYDSYGFIVTENGNVLAHPDETLLMKNLNDINTDYSRALLSNLPGATQHSIQIIADPYLDGTTRMVSYRLNNQNWYFCLVLSESAMYKPIKKFNMQFWWWVCIGLIGLAVILKVVVSIALSPLHKLAISAKELGQGQLNHPLPQINSNDEIGALVEAFNKMKTDLKHTIQEITLNSTTKKMMQQELKIAQEIQLSMVPQDFTVISHDRSLSVFAKLLPARGVGGDLYDIFWLNESYLFFTLGDVSGKGIPAALFMAKTLGLLRSLALELKNPEVILSRANRELAENNHRFMFVTCVCGLLNTQTGEVMIANAGHLPILLIPKNEPAKYLALPPESVLAIQEDSSYDNSRLTLNPGDKFVLYSDGITEAFNQIDQAYGEDRLLAVGETCVDKSAEETTRIIINDVQQFAVGRSQSDDIAVLTIEWHGKGTLPSS